MFLKSSKKFIIENSMREKKFEKKVHPQRGNHKLPLFLFNHTVPKLYNIVSMCPYYTKSISIRKDLKLTHYSTEHTRRRALRPH